MKKYETFLMNVVNKERYEYRGDDEKSSSPFQNPQKPIASEDHFTGKNCNEKNFSFPHFMMIKAQ